MMSPACVRHPKRHQRNIRLVACDLLRASPHVFDIGVRPPKETNTCGDAYRDSYSQESFPAAFGLQTQEAGYKQKSADQGDEKQYEQDQGHEQYPDTVVRAADELLPDGQDERRHEQKPSGNRKEGKLAKEESADGKGRQHGKHREAHARYSMVYPVEMSAAGRGEVVVQDAVAHNEGLGENWKTRRAGSFVARSHEPADRPRVLAYPSWQEWMRKTQPRLLVIWGRYDPSFDPRPIGATSQSGDSCHGRRALRTRYQGR
jgi:hypothetical protein